MKISRSTVWTFKGKFFVWETAAGRWMSTTNSSIHYEIPSKQKDMVVKILGEADQVQHSNTHLPDAADKLNSLMLLLLLNWMEKWYLWAWHQQEWFTFCLLPLLCSLPVFCSWDTSHAYKSALSALCHLYTCVFTACPLTAFSSS